MDQAISERLEMPERKKAEILANTPIPRLHITKAKTKKIASDFDACYPILFRKVYNLKKKNPKCLLFQGVSGFIDYIFDGLY